MRKKNIEHVASHVDQGVTYWEFRFPSEVKTCEEQAKEMIERCGSLFSVFGDFFAPVETSYHIHLYPSSQSLPVRVGDDDHIERVTKKIQNDNGISASEFSESTEIETYSSRYIPAIDLNENNKVKVKLESGDVFASKDSHTIEYQNDSPVEDDVTSSPLDISIFYSENAGSYDIQSDYITIISVNPHSDIWFDDSAADANREYLSAFLGRIESAFPVEEINRFSEWYAMSDLESIY
jgi:hypothetical protein